MSTSTNVLPVAVVFQFGVLFVLTLNGQESVADLDMKFGRFVVGDVEFGLKSGSKCGKLV